MRITTLKTIVVVSYLALAASHSGFTSAQTEIPSTVDPSRIEQDLRPIQAPRSGSDIELPGQQELPIPADLPDTEFTLSGIQVLGAESISIAEIEEIYIARIGTKITLADLYGIANEISALYRNRGYVLSQAVIPEQEISSQDPVKIQVVEGYVSDVTIGNSDISENRQVKLRRYAEKITASRPLTSRALERYLLLINDIPGYAVSATLSPSEIRNAATLTLNIEVDRQKYTARIENRGNDFVGPVRIRGAAEFTDLTAAMNSLSLSLISTLNSELTYALLQHYIPVGSEGLTFEQSIGLQSSEPGGAIEALEIESELTRVDLGLTYPLLRSRRENLTVSGALSLLDSESTQLEGVDGAESLVTEDKLRSVRVGLGYDKLDRFRGLNILAAELGQGVDLWDAEANTRADAEIEFTRASFFAGRLQSLAPRISVFAAVTAQVSSDNLPSSEQFGVGGKDFGSAFDSSEIVGDEGYAGRLELRYTTRPAMEVIRGLVTYGFVDGGEVRRNNPTEDQEETESLSSTGLGLRFDFANGLGGSLEYALPLSNEVASEGNDDGRLFLVLESSF